MNKTKQQHKYQELFNHLNTKEINKLLKILKLDDNVVKDLKKKDVNIKIVCMQRFHVKEGNLLESNILLKLKKKYKMRIL